VTADQIIKELMEEKGSAAKGKGPRSDAGSGRGVLMATIGSVAAVAVAAYFSSEIGKIALLLGMFALVMIMIVLVEGAESGGGYTIPPEYMAGTLPDPRYTADDHQDDEDD